MKTPKCNNHKKRSIRNACQSSSEDVSHLLVLCPVSWHIWTSLASDLGHVIYGPESFRTFYESWISIRFKNQTRRKLWVTTFYAAAWSLWMTRNSMVFDHQELDSDALCYIIRWRVGLWTKARQEDLAYTLAELARNFSSIPVIFS